MLKTSENMEAAIARLKAELPEARESENHPRAKKKLAFFDIETDPFMRGRIPEPFSCALIVEGEESTPYIFWGEDCLTQFYCFVNERTDSLRIYAHNGGKFDFIFLLREGLLETGLHGLQLIHTRIVKARIAHHELRDSYSILPVPLSLLGHGDAAKLDIDYNKMEAENREQHKAEIITYLLRDCEVGLKAVQEFVARFGVQLTIGGTAMRELRKRHPFEKTPRDYDELIRPFYFGGRVQCFETGIVRGDLKVYDVNSMYPAVMADREHFYGTGGYCVLESDTQINEALCVKTGQLKKYPKNYPYFLEFVGVNDNALPTRSKDDTLDFAEPYGTFKTTSHELLVALKYKQVEIHHCVRLIIPAETINFAAFVDEFIEDKISAKKSGDKGAELFAKLILNSSYGKFAQNPDNYTDAMLCHEDDFPEAVENGWQFFAQFDDMFLLDRPCDEESKTFFDTGVGASITGAARAVMMEAIILATRPVYCDTDSLICEKLNGVSVDSTALGAWDLEARTNEVAIYGKKMYALKDIESECWKIASKGVAADASDLYALAKGETVSFAQDAPTLKLDGSTEFMQRIVGAEVHSKLFDKFGQKITTKNK